MHESAAANRDKAVKHSSDVARARWWKTTSYGDEGSKSASAAHPEVAVRLAEFHASGGF